MYKTNIRRLKGSKGKISYQIYDLRNDKEVSYLFFAVVFVSLSCKQLKKTHNSEMPMGQIGGKKLKNLLSLAKVPVKEED